MFHTSWFIENYFWPLLGKLSNLFFSATRENIDDGFEDMLDEEDLEVKPDEYHNLAYAQRKTFVLNMVQGKSGNSTLIDYSFDEEVLTMDNYSWGLRYLAWALVLWLI